MISDGAKMIQKAKQNYLCRVGHTPANPWTSIKSSWSLINSVLNKAKAPNLPPLLENGSLLQTSQLKLSYLMTISFISAQ